MGAEQSPLVWVEPWRDPQTDASGVPLRSGYVERFWTPVIGPTQVLFLRRVADQFDEHPDGFEMDMVDMSRRLGVSPNNDGKGAARALGRLEQFGLASGGHWMWAVRRAVPVLSPKQQLRLPAGLRAAHSRAAEQAVAVWDEAAADRAARVALALAEAGEPASSIRRQVEVLRLPPAVCDQASRLAAQAVAEAAQRAVQPREVRAPGRPELDQAAARQPVFADAAGI